MPTTPINEWEPQAEEVTLSSGRRAKLLRPDLVAMIAGDGDTPDVLSNLVLSMVTGDSGKRELDITPDTLPQIMKSLNVVNKACFVEPKLWDNDFADEEHIPIKWLTFQERGEVFGWALGAKFQFDQGISTKQNGRVATVPAGNNLSRKAQRNIRNKR